MKCSNRKQRKLENLTTFLVQVKQKRNFEKNAKRHEGKRSTGAPGVCSLKQFHKIYACVIKKMFGFFFINLLKLIYILNFNK